MSRFKLGIPLAFGFVLFLLAACSGGVGPPGGTPQISGDLNAVRATTVAQEHRGDAFAGQSVGTVSDLLVDDTLRTSNGKPRLVPGEIIVKRKDGSISTQAVAPLHAVGTTLAFAAATPIEGASLYRAVGLDELQTIQVARALEAQPDIEYAVPNYLKYPSIIPNDTNYHLQWHYPAMRMPEVWDTITGTDVVVAVVDTGIFYLEGVPAYSHPDLFGKVLPGYDFVSDPRNAGDNDGLDPNPYDLQFEVGHGTHVAGTIAAATNNNRDVAGVNWGAKILPVRVLGLGGGSTLDIMQGALWAAGGMVPGVPPNPNPAQVINMSLGGRSVCSPYEQQIFQQIFDLGAIVVVAAGNENDDANRYSPASCTGVITVGATDAAGSRAPYSNYGPRVDIMGPGGDTGADLTADGYVDGVLSLGIDPNSGDFTLKFMQGTSMAAPHIAGLVSLMKGINPSLTGDQALAIMRGTANPLSPAACKRATGQDCGAGMVDALRAIQAVGNPSGPTAGGQTIAYNPDPVEFGSGLNEVTLSLTNTGATSANYSITDVNWFPTNPTDYPVDLLGGSPNSGTIPAGGTVQMNMWLDRSLLTADGSYAFEYAFMIDGQPRQLLGRFSQGVTSDSPSGSTFVVSFLADDQDQLLLDENDQFIVGGAKLYPEFVPEYAFAAVPGKHFVIAWVDTNANEEVDDGDYVGIYQNGVLVGETTGKDSVNIDVARSLGSMAAVVNSTNVIEGVEHAYRSMEK